MISNTFDIKVVLLGGSGTLLIIHQGVGKSSLLARFQHDTFSFSPSTTLGAAFAHRQMVVDGRDIKFQIWDTAGQEKYKALLPLYYRGISSYSFPQTHRWR
jgi:small GTP-binding protein